MDGEGYKRLSNHEDYRLRDAKDHPHYDEKRAAIIIQRTVRHWLKNVS